jgi:SPP1 gp7 family putative phage head morphogenesis protein
MNRRFALLYIEIKKFIVDDDAFGLKVRTPLIIHAATRQYAFATNPQKLRAFHTWLKAQVDSVVFVVSGAGVPGQPWTYPYIQRAYARGLSRAYKDVNKESLAKSPEWYQGSREQFLRTAFTQPVTMNKVELLSLRAFEQLKGVTASMSQQMSRILTTGLVSGYGPLRIARDMQKSIRGLSKSRARMIARTEIINAHAEGQLDSFQLLGVEELGIMAEWATAGDDRVCPDCGGYEGEIFTIDEARGLIPLHPNCRCAWIPSENQRKK